MHEQEIDLIKERNRRVELDKAWETSWTRKIAIAILTYIVAAIWLLIIKETNFLLKAFVPVVGYILSTLSLGSLKQWWVTRTDS
jgi:hypothetical protein